MVRVYSQLPILTHKIFLFKYFKELSYNKNLSPKLCDRKIQSSKIFSDPENMLPRHLSPEVLSALQGVRFIAQHIKDADKDNEVSFHFSLLHSSSSSFQLLLLQVIEDWKYVSMVLDRFFLWIFTLACIGGTCGIIFQAPSLYDQRIPIDQEISLIQFGKIFLNIPREPIVTE